MTTHTFPDSTVIMLRHVVGVGPLATDDDWWCFVIETTGHPVAWPAIKGYKKEHPRIDASTIRAKFIEALEMLE